jgi:hypothetical protein
MKSSIIRKLSGSLNPNVSINYKDSFELVLFRWRYLLKSPNPTPQDFAVHYPIMNIISRKMWYKFRYAFSTIGYDYDDVRNLANIYLVGYLGVFSLKNKDNLAKYVSSYKKKNKKNPSKEEIEKKDTNNFVSFLTQRLEEAGKICSQKNRNIRGTDGVYEAFLGELPVDVSDEVLVSAPERFGYKKLKKKDLEILAKNAGVEPKGQFRTADSLVVRVVEIGPRPLQVEDMTGFYSPENAYTMNPLSFMEAVEEEVSDLKLKNHFDSMKSEEKVRRLNIFINNCKNNPKYAEEVKTAKRLVKEIG